MRVLKKRPGSMIGGADIMLTESPPPSGSSYAQVAELNLPKDYSGFSGSAEDLKKKLELDLQKLDRERDAYRTALKKVEGLEK